MAELRIFSDLPPAPPVPQWLLIGADTIARDSGIRPGISLYGLVYAAFIAGWQAAVVAPVPYERCGARGMASDDPNDGCIRAMRQHVGGGNAPEASGQPEAMAPGSGKRSEGHPECSGIPNGVPAGSSPGGQESVGSGAPGSDGDDPRPAATAWRDGASQERHSGRQPSGESGALDSASTERRSKRRGSALRDLHLCRVCGVAEATGKTVGWEPIEQSSFAKYHAEALENSVNRGLFVVWLPGTYELVGPKINGNPEQVNRHYLWAHRTADHLDAPRDFDGLAAFLATFAGEGIVWHHPDGRMAKLKRRDMPTEPS